VQRQRGTADAPHSSCSRSRVVAALGALSNAVDEGDTTRWRAGAASNGSNYQLHDGCADSRAPRRNWCGWLGRAGAASRPPPPPVPYYAPCMGHHLHVLFTLVGVHAGKSSLHGSPARTYRRTAVPYYVQRTTMYGCTGHDVRRGSVRTTRTAVVLSLQYLGTHGTWHMGANT
jgi:hypothetical protein